MTEHDIPQERDLPAGRLATLKDDLMATIDNDLATEPRSAPTAPAELLAPPAPRRRWRRIAVAAAAIVAGFGIATPLVLGGDGAASANTAMRTPDGDVVITIREGKDPKALQRRLNELGVPAVVDFLESGYGCDRSRSTGWVEEPGGEDLFTWDADAPTGSEQLVFDPHQLAPDQTAVFEFQIDEHGDDLAASVTLSRSTSEVGPCVPVRNDSIVDAEKGVAGG